jgi:hypothetical protein
MMQEDMSWCETYGDSGESGGFNINLGGGESVCDVACCELSRAVCNSGGDGG